MPLSNEIQQFIAQYGNTWGPNVSTPCEEYFESLQESCPLHSNLQCEKAIKYGSHPRQRLDIYWQDILNKNETPRGRPVVVYFHGGGFRAGDNDITPHIHGNIAKYFASNNAISILATYRLLPDCQYPSGIEDITAALTWVKLNVASYGGHVENIFALGQSAGGAHVAMALFSGSLRKHDVVPRGIMLQSAPLWYDLGQDRRRGNMEAYYKTKEKEEILSRSALGIFRKGDVSGDGFPEMFMTVGEFDAEEIIQGNLMFLEVYLRKMKCLPRFEVLKGHNHISYALSIGLEGDEVGPRILEWVRALCNEVD